MYICTHTYRKIQDELSTIFHLHTTVTLCNFWRQVKGIQETVKSK